MVTETMTTTTTATTVATKERCENDDKLCVGIVNTYDGIFFRFPLSHYTVFYCINTANVE